MTGYVAQAPTVRHLLDASAAQFGSKTALIFPDTEYRLSYTELAQRVQATACALSAKGLAKGDRVAVMLPNGPDFVIVFLATLYGGFISVPLDHRSGRAFLDQVFTQCPIDLLVTDEGHTETGITAGALYDEQQVAAPEFEELGPDDRALIAYTSGSTGAPKGVVLGHRQLCTNAAAHTQMYQLTAEDRTLLVLPLHHLNPLGMSLLSSLFSGGTVVIPNGFRVHDFKPLLEQHACTWTALVPSMVEQLLKFADSGPHKQWRLRGVRFVRCSSAPLLEPSGTRFEQRFSVPLIHGMGSTEAGATIFSNPLPPAKRNPASVGRPMGFVARVVREDGTEASMDETGSIEVQGGSMMTGYYNNEVETQKVLRNGWLVTGDVGYYDADGYFYIVGRRSEFVNKGGEKISLSEVDAVLVEHESIAEAATVAVTDEVFGQDLVAFVVIRSGRRFDESELLRHCTVKLGFMRVPMKILAIDSLPRNTLGKVQRSQLAENAERDLALQFTTIRLSGSNTPSGQSSSPIGTIEQILTNTFAEVLGIEHGQIKRNDNFFALGGDSLHATRIRTLLLTRNIGEISIRQFFEQPTVAGIAAYLATQRSANGPVSTQN